jgi:hypothetical protein
MMGVVIISHFVKAMKIAIRNKRRNFDEARIDLARGWRLKAVDKCR